VGVRYGLPVGTLGKWRCRVSSCMHHVVSVCLKNNSNYCQRISTTPITESIKSAIYLLVVAAIVLPSGPQSLHIYFIYLLANTHFHKKHYKTVCIDNKMSRPMTALTDLNLQAYTKIKHKT